MMITHVLNCVHDDEYLDITFDHRYVDGTDGVWVCEIINDKVADEKYPNY